MAITIDATAGGASANSFATEVEFASYVDGRLNASAYPNATPDERRRALAEATRDLSARKWRGRRATDTQALSWPRDWVVNPDDPNHDYYDTNVVPQRVKDATCELALQFLKAGTTDVAARDDALSIKREKIGPLETEYAEPRERPVGIARYPAVTRYLWGLLEGGGGIMTRLVRS